MAKYCICYGYFLLPICSFQLISLHCGSFTPYNFLSNDGTINVKCHNLTTTPPRTENLIDQQEETSSDFDTRYQTGSIKQSQRIAELHLPIDACSDNKQDTIPNLLARGTPRHLTPQPCGNVGNLAAGRQGESAEWLILNSVIAVTSVLCLRSYILILLRDEQKLLDEFAATFLCYQHMQLLLQVIEDIHIVDPEWDIFLNFNIINVNLHVLICNVFR